MKATVKARLETIIALCERMLAEADFNVEQHEHLEIVHKYALGLQAEQVFSLTLADLAEQSHDLRQYLTGIVGYSTLLSNARLSNHANLSAELLRHLYDLQALARHVHWHLDSLTMFATYHCYPAHYHPQDAGMLDMAGYLRAQTDHFVCQRRLDEFSQTNDIPFVYANDTCTKLMLRGLLVAALDVDSDARLIVQIYRIMQMVRVRVIVQGRANDNARVEQTLARDTDEEPTLTPDPLLPLALYTTDTLATAQNGRMKHGTDGDNLLLTVTMPTIPTGGALES